MDKAEWAFALNLGTIVFWAGYTIDYYWFGSDRTVKRMIKRCKDEGKCILCNRQMTIVDSGKESEKGE